ncbi:MAG: bifunctional pyr operon transcriptional regulator/uracil phosphoribosyltransferase PyrR [Oscillospiraceae bacterium]
MCTTKGLTLKAEILDESAMARAVTRISYEIIERNKGTDDLCLIGLFSRGAVLAKRIAAKISELEKREVPVGLLDITPFRDDEKRVGDADTSNIGFDITAKKVIIVDDVIFTGRTARAAMDGLMKRGRPTLIQLAVLIDRGHRELPIRADYIGKNLPTSRDETVKVMVNELDGADKVVIYGSTENPAE